MVLAQVPGLMSPTWLENTPERRLDLDTTRFGPGDKRLAMLTVPSHLPMGEPSLQGSRLDTSGIQTSSSDVRSATISACKLPISQKPGRKQQRG